MKILSLIRLNLLIILPFLYCTLIYAQTETEVFKDSVLRYQGIIPAFNFNYSFNDLIHYNNPDFIQDNLPFYNDSSTIWLRTEMAISSSLLFQEKTGANQHFTSILYQKHLEDSKFDPVRYVLGMAQLGAVGYLVYKRIKKYGFR